jgi:hypothetical protein
MLSTHLGLFAEASAPIQVNVKMSTAEVLDPLRR